mmetsp:Transcript_22032/g.63992  ORF Transcript_22032/g.63992 Transcript_22032/m.63992 type:complete len:125 (+) Transcript_22032:67-441(+)
MIASTSSSSSSSSGAIWIWGSQCQCTMGQQGRDGGLPRVLWGCSTGPGQSPKSHLKRLFFRVQHGLVLLNRLILFVQSELNFVFLGQGVVVGDSMNPRPKLLCNAVHHRIAMVSFLALVRTGYC